MFCFKGNFVLAEGARLIAQETKALHYPQNKYGTGKRRGGFYPVPGEDAKKGKRKHQPASQFRSLDPMLTS